MFLLFKNGIFNFFFKFGSSKFNKQARCKQTQRNFTIFL